MMIPSIRICLWSGPRNISTALMYSFAQRADTVVVDEPLYAHYLSHSPVEHPGRADILATMENEGSKVIEQVILGKYEKAVVFFKQMAHHLVGLSEDFLSHTTNVLLIRDPRAVLNSFSKVIAAPTLADIGIQQQHDMYLRWEARGIPPLVVDSKTILMDPQSTLESLCEAIGIPFDERMLSWAAGPRVEDGVWAPYWYANVHRSTGFHPYVPKPIDLSPRLTQLAAEAMPFYHFLMKRALNVS